jgi:regulator of replication initiation timing
MQHNRNLWIALFAGTVLTGLLMFTLYHQVKPLDAPAQNLTAPADTSPATESEPTVNNVATDEPDLIVDLPQLPEDPTLSQQEVEKLSPQEREQYENLVKTYREVRAQVLNLHRERAQLRQKMDSIIEENTAIDRQLDQLRQEQNKINN